MSKSEEMIVRIKAGKIEGAKQDGLYVFKGVPYATPPVGKRRWLPPEPFKPWTGVRQAQSFGTAAPQNVDELNILTQSILVEEPQSENCLYLNIWSPGLDDARRPVLLWIHGGGFIAGSGSQSY